MSDKTVRGFTLIELLIVVVIIGILASIAIPKFSSTREKAYLAAMKTDLKNLATQQDIYYDGSYRFATQIADAGHSQSEGVNILINEATGTGWAASATHLGLPGESCGIYHGSAAAAGGAPASMPSQVMCSM
jgi:prepilin-type N-terminal cleavage/methylation domain-containing protein